MAVWAGYDTPAYTGLTSASLTGRIFEETMEYLHEDLPLMEFEKPEGVELEYIDYRGDIVDYNSGKQDYFSDYLLQKSEEDALKLVEDKKIIEDDILIANIIVELETLSNFILSMSNITEYQTSISNMRTRIASVYQQDPRTELNAMLDAIVLSFERDVRIIEGAISVQAQIEAMNQNIEDEYEIVGKLNSLNAFVVIGFESVDIFDTMCSEIETLFNGYDISVKEKYYSSYTEIVYNKEKLLAYFREVIREEAEEQLRLEQEAEEERLRLEQEAYEQLQAELLEAYGHMYDTVSSQISQYERVSEYSESVGTLENEITTMLTYLNQLGLDVSTLQTRYDTKKVIVDALKVIYEDSLREEVEEVVEESTEETEEEITEEIEEIESEF